MGFIYFVSSIVVLIPFHRFRLLSKLPPIIIKANKNNLRIDLMLKQCISLYDFKPSPLYCVDYYGTLQTVFQTAIRSFAMIFVSIVYKRELLKLSDGGTVGLDWVEICYDKKLDLPSNIPIIVIMHGICGSANVEYLVHLVELLTSHGYRVVVMVARGCDGVLLTTPFPFTLTRTSDFRETVELIHHRYPNSDIFAMGFSLGGNILMRYLSEYKNNSLIKGAMIVSPAWDWVSISVIWRFVLGLALKLYLLQNITPLWNNFRRLMFTLTMKGYDRSVAGIVGYKNIDDYYSQLDIQKYVHDVEVPTLAISSVDDPICSVKACPTEDASRFGCGLVIAVVEHGGHLGFAEDLIPLTTSWIDRVSVDWFRALQIHG